MNKNGLNSIPTAVPAGVAGAVVTSLDTWKADHAPQLKEWRYTLFLIRRNPLTVAAICIFGLLVLVAILAPFIAPYDPYDVKMRDRLRAPSAEHLFGTDAMGRDIFSRILFGSRITLQVGFLVLFFTSILGVPLGLIAGYFGSNVDALIMRVGDIFLAFPRLVLALAIAATLGGGINNAIIAIAIPGWPWYARLIRSMTLSIREEQYIEAAYAVGSSKWRVVFRHILPNCIGPWLVQASMDMGWAIMSAAALGFLGVGATPPEPEWGLMVSEGRVYFLDQWWMAVFPGLAIFVTVLGYNLLGDGLRDIIDPRMRRARG